MVLKIRKHIARYAKKLFRGHFDGDSVHGSGVVHGKLREVKVNMNVKSLQSGYYLPEKAKVFVLVRKIKTFDFWNAQREI